MHPVLIVRGLSSWVKDRQLEVLDSTYMSFSTVQMCGERRKLHKEAVTGSKSNFLRLDFGHLQHVTSNRLDFVNY